MQSYTPFEIKQEKSQKLRLAYPKNIPAIAAEIKLAMVLASMARSLR
jgi:hypothetical protein